MDENIRKAYSFIVKNASLKNSHRMTASELQYYLAVIEKEYRSIVSSQIGQMENSMQSLTGQLSNQAATTGASLKMEDLEKSLDALETQGISLEIVVTPSYVHESYIDLTAEMDRMMQEDFPDWQVIKQKGEPHRLLTGPAGLRKLEAFFPDLYLFARIRVLPY